MTQALCIGCNRYADEIPEYQIPAKRAGMSADDFVLLNEGTYNEGNGHFLCSACYIAAGMPSTVEGWRAP